MIALNPSKTQVKALLCDLYEPHGKMVSSPSKGGELTNLWQPKLKFCLEATKY